MNGQAILAQRRATLPAQPRPIADIAPAVADRARQPQPGVVDTERPSSRVARATLAELDLSNADLRRIVTHLRREWPQELRHTPGASIVLAGPVGTGKTHIARAIFHGVARKVEGGDLTAPAGRFYHESDLLMAFQPTRSEYGTVEIPRPSTVFGTAPLVVIDDVGSGQNLPFIKAEDQQTERQARYFRVVDWAYTANVALVLTTNLSIKALAAFFGTRTWDRLQEMSRGFIYDFSAVGSWRRKGA